MTLFLAAAIKGQWNRPRLQASARRFSFAFHRCRWRRRVFQAWSEQPVQLGCLSVPMLSGLLLRLWAAKGCGGSHTLEEGCHTMERDRRRLRANCACIALLLAIVSLLPGWSFGANGRGAIDETALALLKGVEAARLTMESGRVKLEITRRIRGREFAAVVDCEFLRDGRRFRRLGAGGASRVTTIYDGERLLQYGEHLGAYVRHLHRGTGEYCFDPRIIGLHYQFGETTKVSSCLRYANARVVRLDPGEVIRGVECAHVFVRPRVDGGDQELHFWIRPGGNFQVLRFMYRSDYRTAIVDSFYSDDTAGGVLPYRVSTEVTTTEGGVVVDRSGIDVQQADMTVKPSLESFGFAGLEMPVGEAVIDEVRHGRIGYWDGSKLTAEFPVSRGQSVPLDAVAPNVTQRRATLLTTLIAVNAAVVTGIFVVAFFRRRRNRSTRLPE